MATRKAQQSAEQLLFDPLLLVLFLPMLAGAWPSTIGVADSFILALAISLTPLVIPLGDDRLLERVPLRD